MKPGDDLHARASELFLDLCDLAPDEREVRLRAACSDEPDLERAVRRMLDGDVERTSAIDAPAFASFDVSVLGDAPHIPGYTIGEKLGEGGMGVVWAATQESPQRRVALKWVRLGAGFESYRRRFEYEAQVLGWLNHPNIAQIYEAGVADTPSGPQPYFAMELVDGQPLDAYLHHGDPSQRERLELFLRICDGVAHAHQRGVIHRDLKPGNILVQPDGQPKVLDFGVARAAEGDADATSLRTATGELVGTLSYMSPEQVRADPFELDGRSDVYALGVLLYEMLSGRRPFELGALPLPEALRIVLEDEAPRLGDVPADLDTIAAKAMDKDVDRRYRSVEELAGDVQRFLRDEPILARPNSTVYQVSKFVRRNRSLVVALTLILVTLTSGVGVASTLYLREQSALEDTEEALARSERSLKRLMVAKENFEELLRAPMPGADGHDVRMIDVLRGAAVEARTRFVDEPDQQGWLLWSIGKTFASLGDYASARDLLLEARELMEGADRVEPAAMAELRADLGESLCDTGELEEAEREMDAARRILQELGGGSPELRYSVYHASAYLCSHAGRPEEGQRFLDDALAATEDLEGPTEEVERLRATALITRANMYRAVGDLDRTADALEEVQRLVAGRNDFVARRAFASQASLLRIQHRFDDAIELTRESIRMAEQMFGERHPMVAREYDRLGSLYRSQGDTSGAREQYERALEVLDASHPAPHDDRAKSLAHLGSLLVQEGQLEDAEEYLMAADEEYEVLGMAEDTMDAAFVKTYLAPLHFSRGEFGAARELVEGALEIKTRLVGPDHYYLIGDLNILADALVHLGEPEAALTTTARALEIVEGSSGLRSGDGLALRHVRAAAFVELGRPEEALEALELSREMVSELPDGAAMRVMVAADVAWCELHLGVDGARARFVESARKVVEGLPNGVAQRDNLARRLEVLESE